MNENEEAPKRSISPFFLAIMLIILILSITAFYQAINAYLTFGDAAEGIYFMMMGVIGLAASTYMLFRTRRGIKKLDIETQRVSTTIQCEKCGFKKIRNFERGDYMFKETETCPKCKEEMMITSIYREAEETQKNRVTQ